jgi:glucose/arabinose dehydrogenase
MLAFGPMDVYMLASEMGEVKAIRTTTVRIHFVARETLRLNPDAVGPCTNVIPNPFILGNGAPQVWSLGLRNPWRFSFDRQTGDLYMAMWDRT